MSHILGDGNIGMQCSEFYSLILHPVAREIKFNHLATSRDWWLND
jgi:hypothetical protein